MCTASMEINNVTLVLTSCGRMDLLEKTLDSFFKFNTYPIERFLITEDSEDPAIFAQCNELNKKYGNVLEFIFNEKRLGQSKSIDKAYDTVTTKYVFHCEEDWEFYKSGFIEDSIRVLSGSPKILQAWIRPKNDRILNKISEKIFEINGMKIRAVLPASFSTGDVNEDGTPMFVKNYMGFSWNPGLKRISDYRLLVNGYTGMVREHLIDHWYRDNGYLVVSLSKKDDDGYVKHIGWDRRAGDPGFVG